MADVRARSIELPHVEGRIDHLAYDAATQRLYVAALGNNTVEVLDVKANAHLRTLPGFREPQGIAVAAEVLAVAVATQRVRHGEIAAVVGEIGDGVGVDVQRVFSGEGRGRGLGARGRADRDDCDDGERRDPMKETH